jgi:hypothetical protein
MREMTQKHARCLHALFIQGDTAKAARDLLARGIILARHHVHQ